MRKRLIEAGWDIACKQGVERMTLNEVAKRAGCARSSVYRYFDNKEQLLGAILQDRVYSLGLELEEQLRKISDPVDQLLRGFYLAVKEANSGPSMQLFSRLSGDGTKEVAGVLQSSLPEIATELFQIDPVFAKARKEGRVRDGLSDEDIMSWLSIIGTGLLQRSGFGSRPRKELAFLKKMLIPSIFRSA